MKIFITGIAGFIGFHLASYLKKRGDFVLGCDNFNHYYNPQLKKERVKKLIELGMTVIDADIRDAALLEKLVVEHHVTHFVHLAAQAGVRHSIHHPEAYVDSNLNGFVQVLEVVRRHPDIKFIYASSSSIYGKNQKVPFSESDPTETPCSLYGATKKSNELIAQAYHHMYGLSVTGLRYFTAYGPWGRPDMAYFSFTDAITQGKPIQVYHDGHMKRDFTYIDDIIEGTVAAIDLGASCEIFNLGNNHPEDVLTLVSLIEKLTGKTAQKQFLPMPPGDVLITYADIAKSQEKLNFCPKISLEEGMGHFLRWFNRQKSFW